MNKKEKFIYLFLLCGIIIYAVISAFTRIFDNSLITNYLVLGLIFVLGLYTITLIGSKEKTRNIKSKDALFSVLVENSNTIYIMMNSTTKKIVYLSNNVEKVLNINIKNKNSEEIVFNILDIQSIKQEMNKWDKKCEYVSGMIEYENIWLKVKMYPYEEKKDSYYIIQIIDSTKEHDRQHLLITQASKIKTRESVLNEITAASYDVEVSVNLFNDTFELKYFKPDMKYFGEKRNGKYSSFITELTENYINNSDKNVIFENLSIDKLKENFAKYELDSKVIRYRLGNKDKDNTWLESTIFFLQKRNNNKVTILTKNVTENAESIREQNVMLQNALNEAKNADKAKTDLIKNISHNIRTPLTNIMGLSQSILNTKIDEKIKEDIKNINESSNEMLNIIDGLLDVSKVNLNKKEEYNVFKLFTRIINNLKEFANNKNIALNLNMDTNLPVVLEGNEQALKEAITEIINNSIKYTEEGKVNVNVRANKKGDTVDLIVTIKDTGVGIEESLLYDIMNSNKSTGYGQIKNIINKIGGKFEIESKKDEFTRVTVTINQKIVEDNKIREMMARNKEAEIFSLKGKKVLIVDDNKLNLKVTSRLLENYELDLTLLLSGEECLELIKEQNDFDLILLDQMMPGINGTEVLKQLKSIEGFKTPVIVVTADAIEGQKEKYLESGFDDYISKPIDRGELSIILKKYLK